MATLVTTITVNLTLAGVTSVISSRGGRGSAYPGGYLIPQLPTNLYSLATDTALREVYRWATQLTAVLRLAQNNDEVGKVKLPITDGQGRSIVTNDGIVVYDDAGGTPISGPNVVIDTSHLADAAVTTNKLGASAVSTEKLAALAVTAAQLASSSVESTKIANAAVGSAAIANAAIGTAHIANAAITTALIGDAQITDAKIINLAGTKIDANTITAGQIAAGTITSTEIAANTITASNIAASTITTSEIAAGTITAADIAALTITAAEIAAGTITGAKIAAATITAGNIAANTITASQIAANTITASQIAASTITTNEIAANTISAGDIAANAITAAGGEIANLAVTTVKIAGQAVTIPASSYTSGISGGAGSTYVTLQTVTITSTGAQIFIHMSCELKQETGTQSIRAAIFRGTTELVSMAHNPAGTSTNFAPIAMSYSETPGSGTVSYHLKIKGGSSTTAKAQKRSLLVLETKK